ncbi:A disintegrin and metalloproteinase with thrombospondin motifs like [Phymastichus coffea]|uniref:A disintegrin and metalloproteinase with thrombospondin motifs like n=1 Tax=Phymastichus coffea TaxID=108790 RepID=UPI00273BACF3|nr:A disintegrin and metalloproteinase with thrombospondin motifs like [Phymastichus coffea]
MLHCFIYLSTLVVASSHGFEVHKLMTPDEVRRVFQSEHDNVPQYEVAQVAYAIHEKSQINSIHKILHLKSSTRDIKLYLEPTEGFLAGKHTPIWKAQGDLSSPSGIKYTRISNAMKGAGGHFYQDPYNLAALYSRTDEHGQVLYEGTIGDDLVIRALPKRFQALSREKRSVSDDYFAFSNRTVTHPNLRKTYDHILYKNKQLNRDGIREKIGSDIFEEAFFRQKRSIYIQPPKTVYPQILVIIDYSHFQSLQTISEVRRYIVSFWNAVDLRYRVFVNPKIRLNIAGIIIATEPNGLPFLKNQRTRPFYGPIVDADSALDRMGRYFYSEFINPKLRRFVIERDFDIAITMTQLNLCNYENKDTDFDCTTLGYAFRNGACTVSPLAQVVKAVGLIEDNGGYIGIVPAAHEIGHLLGSHHDGSEVDDLENPKCPLSDGYIMAGQLTLTKNVFRWSSCSMKDFDIFFHHPRSNCLFDEPKYSRPVRRVLPGRIYSLDEQCDRITGTRACNKDESACIHLDCFIPGSNGKCFSKVPAAEGSDCGHHHYCINGKCIAKNTTQVLLEPSDTSDLIDYGDIEVIYE